MLPSPDTIPASCFWCWASVLTALFQPDWEAVLWLYQPKKHCFFFFFFFLSFQDFFPFSGYLKFFVHIKSSVSLPPFSLWSCIWISLDKIRRVDRSSTSVLVPGIKLEGEIDLTCQMILRYLWWGKWSFYQSSYLSVTINMDALNPEI